MPLIEIKCLNQKSEIISDVFFAKDKASLQTELHQKGYILIKSKIIRTYPFFKINDHDLSVFFLRLTLLIEAGSALLKALQDVGASLPYQPLRYLALHLQSQLKQGKGLIDGLRTSQHPIDPVILFILEQGMNSGKLVESLKNVNQYLEKNIYYRKKFKQATLYPVFLLMAMMALFYLFTQFLLPQVVVFLKEIGSQEQLPLASKLLIECTHFFEKYAWLSFLLIGSFFILIPLFKANKKIQGFLTPFLIALPLVGTFYVRKSTILWLQTMGILYGAGVPFKKCLEQSALMIPNPIFKEKFYSMTQCLLKGDPLSKAMKMKTGSILIFSPFVIALCDLGMKSSRLSEMFLKAFAYEQESLHQQMLGFLQKLEPLLIIVMGGMMLWIVMGVIVPLYSHMQT